MNMAHKDGRLLPQITIGNSETDLIQLAENMPDGLGWWVEQYFRFEVTTSPASQKVQRRDLALFLHYMTTEESTDHRVAWTPRLSRDFQLHVQKTIKDQGRRVWSDKTMLRIMDHLAIAELAQSAEDGGGDQEAKGVSCASFLRVVARDEAFHDGLPRDNVAQEDQIMGGVGQMSLDPLGRERVLKCLCYHGMDLL